MKSIPKNKNNANHNPNNFAIAFKLDLDIFQSPRKRPIRSESLHCGLEQSVEAIQLLHEFEGNANEKDLLCLTRLKPRDADVEQHRGKY